MCLIDQLYSNLQPFHTTSVLNFVPLFALADPAVVYKPLLCGNKLPHFHAGFRGKSANISEIPDP